MNAETDAYYGRDKPSSTYKWGLVLPFVVAPVAVSPTTVWRVVAWFPSRKNAKAYALRVHTCQPFAICRAYL